MLSLAKMRGITPDAVVMDAWYSSLKNLKTIRDHGWVWVTTLRKNRKVDKDISLENLEIPEEGRLVHLRGYGWVTVFKFVATNGRIDYVTTNKKLPPVMMFSLSLLHAGLLRSIIVKLNKLVVLSVVSLAPDGRKEIIFSWQSLPGLSNINAELNIKQHCINKAGM